MAAEKKVTTLSKRDFQDSAPKVKVTSPVHSGPVQRLFLCVRVCVRASVCMQACHFRKWKSSATPKFVFDSSSPYWNWALQLKVNLKSHLGTCYSSCSLSSPASVQYSVPVVDLSIRHKRTYISRIRSAADRAKTTTTTTIMEAEEITKLVDGVYRVSLWSLSLYAFSVVLVSSSLRGNKEIQMDFFMALR